MIIKGNRGEPAPDEEPLFTSTPAQARESALIKSKSGPASVPIPGPVAPRSSIVKRGTYTHATADEPMPESRHSFVPDGDDRVTIPTGDRPAAAPSGPFADPGLEPPASGVVSVGPPVDQQIIEEAKRRAEAIMRQAQLDAKKLLEESKIHCQNALQQAEKEGFELGQQRGLESSTGEMATLILQVRQMLSDTVYAREKVLRSSAGAIADLAMKISERVTQTMVTANPEVIKNQVSKALDKVKDREHITVRVNPQDLDVVRARRDMFQKLLEGPKTFEINGDPKVDRGGVIIETNLGNVDARISTQMQAIHLAMTEVDKRLREEWERAAQDAARQVMEQGLPPQIAAQVQMPAPPEPEPALAGLSSAPVAAPQEGANAYEEPAYEEPAYAPPYVPPSADCDVGPPTGETEGISHTYVEEGAP